MSKTSVKKKTVIAVDILMYALLLTQMLYIFTGNIVHEVLGIAFFLLVVCHIILKAGWIKALLKGKLAKGSKARMFSNIVTVLLLLSIIAMALSGMGVSRTLFPWFTALGYTDLHRYLATAVLTLSVIHGGMHGYIRTKKKKRTVVLICLATAASLALGLFAVPYMNRHFKKVSVNYADTVKGDSINIGSKKPLVVYFTWLENTEVDEDTDAVSGASLLRADGELMGSNCLVADMLADMLGCDKASIKVTGEKYPDTYSKTVSVAGTELKISSRPDIEEINTQDYDSIILVYPLWWGNIPMPVATFLESAKLDGKPVYLVATQGSSGFGSSTKEVKKLAKGADVTEVISIYCEDIPKARELLYDKFKKIFA